MTIEIRELVIQARVTGACDTPSSVPARSTAEEKADEARWIEIITKQVLNRLREQGRLDR